MTSSVGPGSLKRPLTFKLVGFTLSSSRISPGVNVVPALPSGAPVAHQSEPSPYATIVTLGSVTHATTLKFSRSTRIKSAGVALPLLNVLVRKIDDFSIASILGSGPQSPKLNFFTTEKSAFVPLGAPAARARETGPLGVKTVTRTEASAADDNSRRVARCISRNCRTELRISNQDIGAFDIGDHGR